MPYIPATKEEIEASLIEGGYRPAAWDKKPGKKQKPETVFQIAVRKHFAALIGEPGFANRDGVFWYSTDTAHTEMQTNKRTGRKFSVTGTRDKARGVAAGVPDTQFCWPGRNVLYVELKAGKNQPSADQLRMARQIRANGFYHAFVWDMQGVQEIERLLRGYGCPLLGRTTA